MEIGGRRLRLSNLDKVLWPATGFTKGNMLDYYRDVAPALLPHLAGHPVTMRRFPDGVTGLEWYQTECHHRPSWLTTAQVIGPRGFVHEFCVVNDVPSLVWVVNLATIELHPYLGLLPDPGRPAVVVFDLDPGFPAGPLQCCLVALRIREILAGVGLTGVPKSSGSAGLHVYVPAPPGATYEETKTFARQVARQLVGERADLVIDRMSRAVRAGKVFVDWGQNDRMKSTVAPYSLRAMPWPTVSTPLGWDELERAVATGDPRGLVVGPHEMRRRLDRHGDLFAAVLERSGTAIPRRPESESA
jgi:bifunctional non-homologous end joining protein LigD